MKPQAIINRLERAGIRLFLGDNYVLWASNPKTLTPALRRLAQANRAALVDHFLSEYDKALPGRLTPTIRRRVPRTNELDQFASRELWRIAHKESSTPNESQT